MALTEGLRFATKESRVRWADVTLPSTGKFFVEVGMVIGQEDQNTGHFYTFRFTGSIGYLDFGVRPSDRTVRLAISHSSGGGGYSPATSVNSIPLDTFFKLKIEFDFTAQIISVFINDEPFSIGTQNYSSWSSFAGATLSPVRSLFGFNQFAENTTIFTYNINNQHVYDANDSRNTETLLFDSVGGQHATLVNEPTYVDYQDAWYLDFDGVSTCVVTPVVPFVNTSVYRFSIDFSLKNFEQDKKILTLQEDGAGNDVIALRYRSGGLEIFSRPFSFSGIINFSELNKIVTAGFEIDFVDNTCTFFVGDESIVDTSVILTNLLAKDFNLIFGAETELGSGAANINLYKASVLKDAVPIRNYNPTASNGTGLILEDEIGGNDGTLVNFPTDNSQWVYSPVEVDDSRAVTLSVTTSTAGTATRGVISSVVRPVISSVIQSAIGGTVSAVAQAVRRYFTTFNQNAQSHITLSSPIELDGDFEIEALVQYLDANWITIASGSNFRFSVTTGGSLRAEQTGNKVTDVFSQDLLDRKLVRVGLKRVSSDTTVSVYGSDGLVKVSRTNQNISGSIFISTMGMNVADFGGSDLTFARMADYKIWKGGDRNTGTLVLDMPIDKQYENAGLVENKSAALSANLYTDNTLFFAQGGGQLIVSQGVIGNEYVVELDGTGFGRIVYPFDCDVGKSYLLTFTTRGTTAYAAYAQSATSASDRVSANGLSGINTVTLVYTASQSAFRIFVESANQTDPTLAININSISIKEIPATTPIGTFNNITLADSQEYTQDSDGNWKSGETVLEVN